MSKLEDMVNVAMLEVSRQLIEKMGDPANADKNEFTASTTSVVRIGNSPTVKIEVKLKLGSLT